MDHLRIRIVLISVVVLCILMAGGYYTYTKMSFRPVLKDTVTATTEGFRYEVVDTVDKQELGLGGRAHIDDNYGMLFVFPKDDRYGFWMKDMLVPIDMIWLSDNGTILLVDHDVDPATYPHAFYPPSPVRYVLETRAGLARDKGWDVGTKISLPAPYGT